MPSLSQPSMRVGRRAGSGHVETLRPGFPVKYLGGQICKEQLLLHIKKQHSVLRDVFTECPAFYTVPSLLVFIASGKSQPLFM